MNTAVPEIWGQAGQALIPGKSRRPQAYPDDGEGGFPLLVVQSEEIR